MSKLREQLQANLRGSGPAQQNRFESTPLEETSVEEAVRLLGKPGVHTKEFLHSAKVRSAMRTLLNDAVSKEYQVPKFEKHQGIVICGGGGKYFPLAYTNIFNLRQMGCSLPIELWYIGPFEMTKDMIKAVLPFNVEVKDCFSYGNARMLAGWESKPHSIIHSSFNEVLYLDADNLAAKDPTYLFDYLIENQDDPKNITNSNAVFWPDLPNGREWIPAVTWDIADVDVNNRNKPAFESGQVLVNKTKCWKELQVTAHINNYSDYWYEYVYGDKDTFKLAWHKCGSDYSMPMSSRWINPTIQQHDFSGEIIFYHAVQGKIPIERGQLLPSVPQDINNNIVNARKELRRTWNEIIVQMSKDTFEKKCISRAVDITMGDGTILTRCLGKHLIYCPPEDLSITPCLRRDGYWESWVTLGTMKIVKSGWKCVNIGANVGYYSCILADLSGEPVHAFEPVHRTAELLRRTASENNFDIRVHQEACWSENCYKEISYDYEYLANPTLCLDEKSLKETVKCVKLDDIIDHADLIFIDAEGSEDHILGGAHRLMSEGCRFIVEINPNRTYQPGWLDTLRILYPFRWLDYDGNVSPIGEIKEEVMLYLSND